MRGKRAEVCHSRQSRFAQSNYRHDGTEASRYLPTSTDDDRSSPLSDDFRHRTGADPIQVAERLPAPYRRARRAGGRNAHLSRRHFDREIAHAGLRDKKLGQFLRLQMKIRSLAWKAKYNREAIANKGMAIPTATMRRPASSSTNSTNWTKHGIALSCFPL